MPGSRWSMALVISICMVLAVGPGGAGAAGPPAPYRIATGLDGSTMDDGLVALGDRLFWVTYGSSVTPSPDSDLWTSDGTAAGTKEFFDPRPGGRAGVSDLHGFQGGLVFTADSGTSGRELWTSDGSVAGTRLVADLSAGAKATHVVAVTSTAVFLSADDGQTGRELYRWTGSGTPTRLQVNLTATTTGVDDLKAEWRSDWASSHPQEVGIVGDTLIFSADNTLRTATQDTWGDWYVAVSGNGRELWRVGATGSPSLVRDITTQDVWGGPDPTASTDFGRGHAGTAVLAGSLYFVITVDGAAQLWRTDGTTAGTVASAAALPVPWDSQTLDWDFDVAAAGGRLYYASWSEATGYDGIHSTAGTGAGSRVGPAGEASGLTPLGTRVIYSLDQPDSGDELWAATGTTSALLKDIRPGTVSANPFPFEAWREHLYFGAADGSGRNLYRTDGTAAGTIRVHDLPNVAGALVDGPVNFGGAANRLYFLNSPADSRVVDNELWAFDPLRVTSSVPSVTVTAASLIAYGTSPTVTIKVSGDQGVPTGRVTLRDGTTVIGTADLVSGSATVRLPATLSLGAHPLVATYTGDASYDSASSATRTVTVKAAARLAGRISAVSFTPSTRASVTATLTTTPTLQATGTMRVLVDGQARVVKTLTTTSKNRLTFTLPTLTVGTHTVQVTYSGSSRVMSARTGKVTVTVIRP